MGGFRTFVVYFQLQHQETAEVQLGNTESVTKQSTVGCTRCIHGGGQGLSEVKQCFCGMSETQESDAAKDTRL